MSNINIIIRTADKTRKAELSIDLQQTGADIIQSAVENWSLPTDTDYSIVNTTSGTTIAPNASLKDSGVADGNILEIQPVLVAG
jgi:uncharacterized ubiquitin-like protein YukD